MLNITEEQLYIAWTYSLICKPEETFAFHSRKAVKSESVSKQFILQGLVTAMQNIQI